MYEWKEGETSTAGKYHAEFELFFAGGGKLSVPRFDGIGIQIIEDINNT